jgi:hypothetical protein
MEPVAAAEAAGAETGPAAAAIEPLAAEVTEEAAPVVVAESVSGGSTGVKQKPDNPAAPTNVAAAAAGAASSGDTITAASLANKAGESGA